MDKKSEEIYKKIENFLEERKGRERRDKDVAEEKGSDERRSKKDRRQNKDQD